MPTITLKGFSGVYSCELPDEKYIVKKNDFVIALSGATFGKVGKIIDDIIAYINQRVATFRTKQSLEYFYQLARTDDFKNYISSIPSTSAQPNISNDDILKFETAIPCIEEQTAIANFLSSIDEKIETEKKILQQYENQKKYLLQNMFV
jgi:type I restriction enzyme S subunit